MCVTVYTLDAQQAGGLYVAPTSSTSRPIGVGLMEWDDKGEVPSYDDSRTLSVEDAVALRNRLTDAINAERVDPGRATRAAIERDDNRTEAEPAA